MLTLNWTTFILKKEGLDPEHILEACVQELSALTERLGLPQHLLPITLI